MRVVVDWLWAFGESVGGDRQRRLAVLLAAGGVASGDWQRTDKGVDDGGRWTVGRRRWQWIGSVL